MKKKNLLFSFLTVAVITSFVIYRDYRENKIKIANEKEKIEIKIDKNKDIIIESIFKKYYSKAHKTLSTMTLEEKVGQLFLVRYNKDEVSNYNNYYPGGYILFARDFENHTKESIKAEIANDQQMSKYPLIMGVDEEGGFVTRISRFPNFRSERFKAPKAYYEEGGLELLESTEKEKAALLKEIGINLNLAPVADVSTDKNDFIYNRAFGYDAKKTSELVKTMVEFANQNKINSCLKHFPGYGNNVDTHTGIAIDSRPYDNFLNNDFLPFEAGIEAKVPSVLISHNIIKAIDSEYPASLSKKVIDKLRNNLNFTGIIMTDDLAMDAVSTYVSDNYAATLAIKAGNDMIITSNFIDMYNEVLNSLKNHEIDEETLDRAVLRIIAWKYYSNLFNL